MPGPIDSLRFVHTALEREFRALDSLVSGAETPEDAAALRGRFEFLERLCHGHTHGEEVGLFPALDAKAPGVSAAYLFDHGDERAAFGRIGASLDACAKGDATALAPLAREVTILADHVTRHIRKENELVLPLVHQHFPAPEQGAIVGRIVSVFSPEEMASMVPFIVRWLDPDDRVRYASILATALPEPALRGLAGRIREALDEGAWSALAKAVPALA